MANTVTLKSKSTGLIGEYPADHFGQDDDLVIVDSEGNICLPCMGMTETPAVEPAPAAKTQSKDKN